MALVTGVHLKALSTWLLSLSLGSQASAEAQTNRCDASFEEYSKAGNERFEAAELAFAEGDWVRAEHLSVEVAYHFQCAAQRNPDDPLDPLRYAYNALANLKERLPGGPTKETQCVLKKVCEQLLPLLPNDDASATYKHRCKATEDACPEQQKQQPPPPPPPPRPHRLLVAGSTLLGLGIGALAAMSAGLIVSDRAQEDLKSVPENERLPVFARGHLGNALAWGAGASGAVLVISGVTLLAVGLRLRSRGRVRVEPRPAPGAFSLHLSARF